jgi:hypothetical protein
MSSPQVTTLTTGARLRCGGADDNRPRWRACAKMVARVRQDGGANRVWLDAEQLALGQRRRITPEVLMTWR